MQQVHSCGSKTGGWVCVCARDLVPRLRAGLRWWQCQQRRVCWPWCAVRLLVVEQYIRKGLVFWGGLSDSTSQVCVALGCLRGGA